MADKPQRPKVSSERTRLVSRPVHKEKKETPNKAATPVQPTPRPAAPLKPPPKKPVVPRPFKKENRSRRTEKDTPAASSARTRQPSPSGTRSQNRKATSPFYRVIQGGAGRKQTRMVIALSIVAVILATVILIQILAPAGLIELIETSVAGFGTGDGFPEDIGATTDQSIATVGGDVAVLTDTSLLLVQNDGYRVFDRQHGYSDPVLSASTSRMLVYDRGGTKLRVENAARSLGEITLEHGIITADLGYNGAFVVATGSGEHLCDVSVYNSDLQKIYTWGSATRYVTCVSMSDGGRYFAVGVVSVESGVYVSHVIYFDCRSTEPVYTQEYRGSTLLSVDCKSGDRVVAVFDNMLSGLDRKGQHTDYNFDGRTLQAFDNKQNVGVAVSLTKYNQPQDAELVLFNNALKECGGGQTEGIVQSVSMSGKRSCVLLRDRMVVFDLKGNLLGTVAVDSDSLLVANTNSRATVVGSSTVGQYDITRFSDNS